jgi:D-arabinonate dehydratase
LTYVRTNTGHEGVGYSLGYEGSGVISHAVERLLAPLLEGEDPRDTERLWRRMFDGNVQVGRKGVLLRAISTVDMALWDVKAKAAGEPLYKLLGGWRDAVPSYASGGYYRDEKGTEKLREEIRRYIAEGHDVVKMKVGRLSVPEEVERVAAVREELGPDRTLLMDANGAWGTKTEAVRACRAFAEHDPYFIEEPVPPDSVELMAAVNAAIDYPVAAGELEFSRYGFAQLLNAKAVDIPQPDVTVVGGSTE